MDGKDEEGKAQDDGHAEEAEDGEGDFMSVVDEKDEEEDDDDDDDDEGGFRWNLPSQ